MDMINHHVSFNRITMRKLFIYVALCSVLFATAQQKPSIKFANKLFANKAYVQAAKMYETLKPSRVVLQNLGDCYYYNAQMDAAVKNYGQLFFQYKDSVTPDYYFRYGHALKAVKDYDKADKIFGEYYKYEVKTQMFVENLRNIVPFDYELQLMTKTGDSGDFGMSFYKDGKVVFASLRNTEQGIYGWNDKPYLDLFEATVTKDNQLENIVPFPKSINTKTHESNAVFSADGKIMFFSRTNDKRVKVGNEKFASVKIFRAEWDGTDWKNCTALPFCSDTYSTQHPSLSPDGKRLYFSSDRPGGFGSFDLYYVEVKEDGTYSEPINLGDVVNTPQLEQFPFITSDGTLYFASNVHEGLGGLDIFVTKNADGKWVKPLDLGETINSGYDDFGYVLNEKTQEGYFSSNRKGTDNLYSFKRKDNERRYIVEGSVKDKVTKQLLPGTQVSLYDENEVLVGQMVVGSNAEYFFNTKPNKKYRIEAIRDLYIPHSEFFTTDKDGNIHFEIELIVESYDDAEDIVVTKTDGYVYIELENIYFDLNKWDIKPEAAKILDVLVGLMKKYPRMEIQIGAHTDSRATETYNLMLSNNRAASTLEYIVTQGVDRNRLRHKGFGESMPLVNCGDKCTEAEHSINRRCEFRILK